MKIGEPLYWKGEGVNEQDPLLSHIILIELRWH